MPRPGALLLLRKRLGKERRHSVLVADVHMQWLTELLDAAVKGKKKDEQLFATLTLPKYEASFVKFCVARGYTTAGIFITPHTVRHAGASNDRFHKRRSLKEIQKRGRCAAPASVNQHGKEALILSAWAKLDAIQQKKVCDRAKALPAKLRKSLKP
jgi:hypothetical protein